MIKSDRLLIVGTANTEAQVYEIVWLNGESCQVEEPSNKLKNLIGADTFEREPDQGNVRTYLFDLINLFRSIQGNHELYSAWYVGETDKRTNVADGCLRRRIAALLLGSFSLTYLLYLFTVLQGSDSVIDVFRIFSDEETRKRFKKKLHKAKKNAKWVQLKFYMIFPFSPDDNHATEREITRDISLMLLRVGTVDLPSKVKWADLFKQVKTTDSRVQYRMCCLLRTNTVHGVLMNLNTKDNKLEAESIVDLDHVSTTTPHLIVF